MRTLIAVWLACLALTACGDGGGGSSDKQPLSGNWQLMLTNTATSAVKSESGFFVQSGKTLTGGLLLTGGTACPGVGSAQGQVDGSNVTINVSQVGETVNLTGTTAGGGSQMSGDYSIFASPCGANQVGTFTATQVHTLTGSFSATFTSGITHGLVMTFTGTVTQGPNSGASTTTLTGTMTSTYAPCLSTASVTGQISGTAVVFNLLTPEGTVAGQMVGTLLPDASAITGTYDLFPQSSGTCRDFGTAAVTVQPGAGG
jgi:hypothetical protein